MHNRRKIRTVEHDLHWAYLVNVEFDHEIWGEPVMLRYDTFQSTLDEGTARRIGNLDSHFSLLSGIDLPLFGAKIGCQIFFTFAARNQVVTGNAAPVAV